ncbi:hypothetical protein ABW22_02845 [Thiobacillus denitrificans]|uniref:Uncharacterized protein n=1 Tax=Thiobacillus denitrificans TaxID=36861 RepID=A0A119CXZ8_THIDE|nr:hypothetical protein ABW22_02845 [Thiobacillus denitrificans]
MKSTSDSILKHLYQAKQQLPVDLHENFIILSFSIQLRMTLSSLIDLMSWSPDQGVIFAS